MMDDEEIGAAMAEPKKYLMTDKKDWRMHKGGEERHINPVLFTGEAEQFGVKLEEGNLKKMWDGHETIHFILFLIGCSQRSMAMAASTRMDSMSLWQ